MKTIASLSLGLSLFATTGLAAPVNSTGLLTNTYFNGSGNENSSFTGTTENGVEIGLRGKLRYGTDGNPKPIYNYDDDRTYTFSPDAGYVAPANRSVFNWDWSVDVDPTGTLGRDLIDLTYEMRIDLDPTVNAAFYAFDPINMSYADHKIGDETACADAVSSCNAGANARDIPSYAALIAGNSIAQNSWNLGFSPWGTDAGFDPQGEGQYTIELLAFDGDSLLASTSIDIIYGTVPTSVVPLPASLPLMLAALGGVGVVSRRRRG